MKITALLIIFTSSVAIVGCDSDSTELALSTCVPGDVQACACAETMLSGIHTCEEDGTWGTCECGDPPQTCIEQFALGCHNGNVHWYDSCDAVGSLAVPCAPCERCVPYGEATATCEASVLEHHRECGDQNQVYWYDSCGARGAPVETCLAPKTFCSLGECHCEPGLSGDDCLDCEGGRYDPLSGLCWSTPSTTQYSCTNAQAYCADLDHGGHTNWRLATGQEFVALLEHCDSTAATLSNHGWCDSCDVSSDCARVFGWDTGTYWTYTLGGAGGSEFFVSFGTGRVQMDACATSTYLARCVRPLF